MNELEPIKEFTKEELISAFPKGLRKNLNQEVLDELNKGLSCHPEIRDHYRNNILGYMDVLQEGRFSMKDYINAVRFVSYKLFGYSNIRAYEKTFPDRWANFIAAETPTKDIQSYASMYNKTKLVSTIYAQTLVPTYVLNADIHQEAINAQAELMRTARSEKVRCDAANSLLTHLKVPEAQKVSLEVKPVQDNTIEELKEITRKLALQQKEMIENGSTDAKTIAESSVVSTVPAVEQR